MQTGSALLTHYSDVIMNTMASQTTCISIVYSTVCSGVDQRKSSASLAFVRGIHLWSVNSPRKGPVMRKMFPFDYVITWTPWNKWVMYSHDTPDWFHHDDDDITCKRFHWNPPITGNAEFWRFSLSMMRHQMETFSALLALCAGNLPVSGEFPAQRSVTRSFDVFFDLCLNRRLSKQSWGWWFEKLSSPLWRHCNALAWPWSWINSRVAGDLIRHDTHVMSLLWRIHDDCNCI